MSTPQTSWSGPALTGTAPDNRLIGFVLLAVSKICPLHTRMGDLRRRRVSGSRLPAVARRAWRAAAATRAITRPCQVPLCDGRPSTGSPCPLPGRSLPALPLARRHGYGMPGRPVKGVAAARYLPRDRPQPAHAVRADDLLRDGRVARLPRSGCAPSSWSAGFPSRRG